MEELRKHLSKVSVPCGTAPIYKDECVFSYDNPETPTGLYVCLQTFLGFGEAFVCEYAAKTGNAVFLHIKRERKLKAGESHHDQTTEAGPERKITRLAIGVDGGYNESDLAKKYEIKDTYSIVVAPHLDKKLPYPDAELPMRVTQAVEAVLEADSAIAKLEKATLMGTWDGEVRQASKHAENLQQLDNGKKIPPAGWQCEKCELTNNLWLNLTDGSIMCGRKFFDGSGGNDHAVEHYRQTGYPLAVKLGTISADGKSDVFSYPEDDMVLDPHLGKHLKHFGINMAAMQKCEKSMVELELEINQRIGEWSALTESESELQPLAGPGLTGMRNLGNSCYINSVMQVLFAIPDFQQRFVGSGAEHYFKAFPSDPANDFNIQMAKLGNGLQSGKYSSVSENSLDMEHMTGISPVMFKNIVGKNHPEFSTKQQQDANEFYLHLLSLLDRNSRNQFNPADALKFQLEDRVECMTSHKVNYRLREEYTFELPIPLEQATNLDEVREYQEREQAARASGQRLLDRDIVRHKVPLQACLERFFGTEIIDQFFSTAINAKTTAKKNTLMATMPDFLMIHLGKFTLGDDWVPKKLDVSVDMPDDLDLSVWHARGGLQAGEELLPEPTAEPPKFVFDEHVMSELVNMGFPPDACKRACFHTQNSSLEAASNWLMEHIADPDISDPFEVPANNRIGDGAAAKFVANPESLAMLMSMGFDEMQAVAALKATDGNVERATDWIFSHADCIDEVPPVSAPTPASAPTTATATSNYRDGNGKYKLMAFISHMGTSAQVGHYVCHIRKQGEWVIFNDTKVAKSQNPPKDLGYLYLYMRED
ncbi:ubiquitin carboxyl-terminal hydrolase 5 [Drosophila grimshawi]|uniref:Ubiquitin carboxyl-terminal hydrolase n=1 Tax=Drosophila grimshawi TaxID=7222 RepID=B4IZQ1_DROGR|nr:ubiquitin carboxyl-terminal hydrolase 5 [Drosophila grimshawi]EDV95636.1 GH15672 [Drosophila grimshawi]